MESSHSGPWARFARTRLTTRQPNETLNEHLFRLEDDIEQLKSTLIFAKELRNASTPIFSLPNEIILEIMLVLRDLDFTSKHDAPRNGHPTTWEGFLTPVSARTRPMSGRPTAWETCSSVCRRFRRIALDAPTLFTRFASQMSSWDAIERGMKLSRKLDLHLEMEGVDLVNSTLGRAACRSLIRHGRRITSFAVEMGSETVYCLRQLITMVPNATSLEVSWKNREVSIFLNVNNLGSSLSKLSSLTMKGTNIHFHGVLPNLVELRLHDLGLDSHHAHHGLDYILAQAKSLRRLALVNIDHFTLEEHLPQGNVPLPNSLRHIEYVTPVSLRVLRHIQPSRWVKVQIVQTAPPSDSKNNAQPLINILDAWLGKENRASEVSLTIRYNTTALEARLAFWKLSSDRSAGDAPDLEIVRNVDEDFHIGDLLLGSAHSQTPVHAFFGTAYAAIYEKVLDLSFDVEWEYPLLCCSDDWVHCLSPFKNLRSLRISGPRTLVALPHMSRWPGRDAAVLWPSAQLFLEDRGCMGDAWVLLTWLADRAARGMALPVLAIPAHVANAMDETAVATDFDMRDWRDLVQSDVQIDYKT